MIEYILVFGAGGLVVLYFTNEAFRTKVKDLVAHVKELFTGPPAPPKVDTNIPE